MNLLKDYSNKEKIIKQNYLKSKIKKTDYKLK